MGKGKSGKVGRGVVTNSVVNESVARLNAQYESGLITASQRSQAINALKNSTTSEAARNKSNTNQATSVANESVPNEYKLSTGEDARTYFGYGSYQNNYTIKDFVRDSRNVSLYGGIDFERSGSAYSEQGRIYEESRKRWRKQIQYNREYNNGRRNLTEVSINKLKTMYNNSTSEDIRRRIAAELNVRGVYRSNGKWKNRGGGR